MNRVDISGHKFRLSKFKGTVIIVNVQFNTYLTL